jgi:hypothetical protein
MRDWYNIFYWASWVIKMEYTTESKEVCNVNWVGSWLLMQVILIKDGISGL